MAIYNLEFINETMQKKPGFMIDKTDFDKASKMVKDFLLKDNLMSKYKQNFINNFSKFGDDRPRKNSIYLNILSFDTKLWNLTKDEIVELSKFDPSKLNGKSIYKDINIVIDWNGHRFEAGVETK